MQNYMNDYLPAKTARCSERLAVAMTLELKQHVEAEARRLGIGVAAYIRAALQAALDHPKAVEPVEPPAGPAAPPVEPQPRPEARRWSPTDAELQGRMVSDEDLRRLTPSSSDAP